MHPTGFKEAVGVVSGQRLSVCVNDLHGTRRFGELQHVVGHPDTEDTVYTYGSAGDTHGAAGKILSVTDASGSLEYEYGKLGQVTKEARTIATHLNRNNPTETAVMEYRSDYLGRMQWIVYPDGEKVTYGYDRGGQVVSVTGKHYGYEFNYVTNILYDEYGQRTRIDYGNGTFTECLLYNN